MSSKFNWQIVQCYQPQFWRVTNAWQAACNSSSNLNNGETCKVPIPAIALAKHGAAKPTFKRAN